VDQAEIAPEAQWAVRGDRALTAAAEPPDRAEIVAGAWWPAGYDGPPLISLDEGLARGFGVDVGDALTLNVLGRELNVKIASLRRIDWQAIPFDFAVILSPGALAGAPVTHVAAVFADAGREDAVESAVASLFSNITAIRVRDALDAINGIIRSIGDGIRAAGSITVVAGILVLGGAMAADRRRRTYDSVLFKVLGATRTRLARLYMIEYGLLGLGAGVIATVIGSAAAWAVTVFVMRTDWVFLPGSAALVVALSVVVTSLVGFAGTWRILGRKAAPYLRNE
jgi:putative ABC transport system permease protein